MLVELEDATIVDSNSLEGAIAIEHPVRVDVDARVLAGHQPIVQEDALPHRRRSYDSPGRIACSIPLHGRGYLKGEGVWSRNCGHWAVETASTNTPSVPSDTGDRLD